MMYKMTIRVFDVIAVITEDEIICEDEFIKQLLLPYLETGFTEGPQYGHISKLGDIFRENVELISIEGVDPDAIY